jgi:hypothetical protein
MPEHEARRRAVYDHTDDEPRPSSGRRRRQVADWGVGEELFDGMPGRRFDRRGLDHAIAHDDRGPSIQRGGARDGRRTIVITEDDVRFEDEAPAEEFASREDALEARRAHDAIWAGDEPFADPADVEPVDEPAAEDEVEADEASLHAIVRGGVEGRRTVKIGGRPAEFHPTSRRSSRTVHERLGPRPDRIAAWAFALGILLILIAIATANI